MKRKVLLLTAVLLFILVGVEVSGESHKALIIKDGECALFDGAGNIVVSSDRMVVVTPSRDGRVRYSCRVKDVPNDTGRAVHYDYVEVLKNAGVSVLCGFQAPDGMILTDEWSEVVSTDGNATLNCSFQLD